MSLWSQILQFLIAGLSVGAIYALIALGFSIIYNATGIVNFAQGEFVMLGAMLAIFLHGGHHLPLPLAFLIAVLAVTLIAALVERTAIRPLRREGVLVLIIATIAVSMVLRGGAMLLWGKEHMPLAGVSEAATTLFQACRRVLLLVSGGHLRLPVPRLPETVTLGGAIIRTQSLWVLGIALAAMAALQLFYARTVVGKAMRATAINREGAALVGVSPSGMVFWSFALSGGLGAMAGILIAPIHMAAYNMGTMLGLKGFAAAVLGGLGSSVGGIAGGLALGALESLGAGLAPSGLSGYRDAFAFAVLLIVLFIRPTGIFGARVNRGE